MTFLEQRLSTAVVRRSTTGGPTARRVIHRTDAGIVSQVIKRRHPLHRYTLDFGNKIIDEGAEEIRAFFYVVMFGAPGGGAYEGFRARDWNDYQLTRSNSRLVAVTGGFQIHRVYAVGAAEYLRPIRKVEPGSATVFNGAAPVVATVDNNTGIVTSGGNAAYTVEANFDVPVTFVDDAAFANVGLDGNPELLIQTIGEIELEELPLVLPP